MYDYVVTELPQVLARACPQIDTSRAAITGHSMGGHGALTIGLKNPDRYASFSAFSPIVAPTQCPWGEKALSNYLGSDTSTWDAYDTCKLLGQATEQRPILIDQGTADNFLEEQLKTHLIEEASRAANYPIEVRMQEGYDHSYYFIASFIESHLAFHARHLGVTYTE
jgi:S-formylglutathione hydrolase